jgi:hypothetical protein
VPNLRLARCSVKGRPWRLGRRVFYHMNVRSATYGRA